MSISKSEDEIATVDRYLKAKGVALWSNWDITDDEERDDAARWLHETITELMAFIDVEKAGALAAREAATS